MDEMEKRIGASERHYEKMLLQTYEKEKQAFVNEGHIGRFESWAEYKTGHRGGAWTGFEATCLDELKEKMLADRLAQTDEKLDTLQEEIDELTEERDNVLEQLRELKKKGNGSH